MGAKPDCNFRVHGMQGSGSVIICKTRALVWRVEDGCGPFAGPHPPILLIPTGSGCQARERCHGLYRQQIIVGMIHQKHNP